MLEYFHTHPTLSLSQISLFFLCLFQTNTCTRRHIPKYMFPRQNFLEDLARTLYNGASVSLGRCSIHKHCLEFSSFCHHIRVMPKRRLICFLLILCSRGTIGSCPDSWLLHLYRRHEGQFDSFRWCLQEEQVLLKSTAPQKWNMNSCPSLV